MCIGAAHALLDLTYLFMLIRHTAATSLGSTSASEHRPRVKRTGSVVRLWGTKATNTPSAKGERNDSLFRVSDRSRGENLAE